MRTQGPREAQAFRGPSSPLLALALLVALAVSIVFAVAPGSALAQGAVARSATPSAAPKPPATCVIHSLPSFVAQGEDLSGNDGESAIPGNTEAMVADVIEVECNPTLYGTGSKIKVTANQLYTRCQSSLTWYVPNPFSETVDARGVTLRLDADGNATVALRAGPECAAGESLITAHMEEEPFESFTTSFSVLPPVTTAPGVFALPAAQVEDSSSSAVATIIEAEFPGGSEKLVHIASEELFHRCQVAPHLRWIRMNGATEVGVSEVDDVQLDNDGNAFVIAIGDGSCAEGPSLIEADLLSKPFTTFMTGFTILPPQPTGEASFTIEKSQRIGGGAGGFTTSPLTAAIGQTVEYEIVVTNTASVSETFGEFTDTHCDPGTTSGGPGANAVAAGESTTYTCDHVLTAIGPYTNEASVTGTAVGEPPLTHTSNQVVAEVPRSPEEHVEVPPTESLPQTVAAPPGEKGIPRISELGEKCAAPVLHGASGPKRGPFNVQVSANGIKQITFYLDGRKLKTLKSSQAKGGKFTVRIDPTKLSHRAHTLSFKALSSESSCAKTSRSSTFVHPSTERVAPKFTG